MNLLERTPLFRIHSTYQGELTPTTDSSSGVPPKDPREKNPSKDRSQKNMGKEEKKETTTPLPTWREVQLQRKPPYPFCYFTAFWRGILLVVKLGKSWQETALRGKEKQISGNTQLS